MAGKGATGLFFTAIVVAVGAVAFLLLREDGGGQAVPEPAPPPKADGGRTETGPPPKPTPAEEPAEAGIEATPEACLAFLRTHAGEPRAAPGGITFVYPEVRMAALEALASLEGVDATPELRAALSGDGDAEDWFESRLLAAGILARRGDPAGAAALREYVKASGPEEDAEVAAVAGQAAAWLPAEEAGNLLRRLLVNVDEYDDESLATVLRAVATVGAGSTPAELRRILEDEEWDEEVRGAAAGALLRLGDPAGEAACRAFLEGDEDFVEDFVLGLGARGNAAALPPLRAFLADGDAWTRVAAAEALGVVGDPAAVEDLRKALADEDGDVRDAAAIALGLLGADDGLETARGAARGSKDHETRADAFRVLGDRKDGGARESAASLLAAPLPPRTDRRRISGLVERLWAARLIVQLAE